MSRIRKETSESSMAEEELIQALIDAFKIKRDFWQEFSSDRAWGIQECINHLYAYQAIKEK